MMTHHADRGSFKDQFWLICSIFLAANLIAGTINHIDDTDETYGYYEPLHYLLYGTGMQTWEYAPQFAIRTYAFIAPFWGAGFILKSLDLQKLSAFYSMRVLLGSFTAASEASFVSAVYTEHGTVIGDYTFLFTLFSSGILYCSTALLPSAVVMSFVMLASASWMRGRYVLTVLTGCISVLWSGWPFIGIVFVPFGLHMLVDTYQGTAVSSGTSKSSASSVGKSEGKAGGKSGGGGVLGVFVLCLQGGLILCLVAGSAAAVDFYMYNRRTFPTWNILAYNAIGGSGDELYGVEPMGYYVRNLSLNMGISWPLAVAAPVLMVREWMHGCGSVRKGVLLCPAVIWLCVLFSRPHKEERFLYPAYPLLALMAAHSLSAITDIVCDVFSEFCGDQSTSSTADTAGSNGVSSSGGGRGGGAAKGKGRVAVLRRVITAVCVSLAFLLCAGRTTSNYVNYSGYLTLWTSLGQHIAAENVPYSSSDRPLTVCMGGEWYTFPSHFFLPSNVRLEYVRGTFHGQLPQHFHRVKGTSAAPLQPFNDMNSEEMSRYVDIGRCEYLVATVEGREGGEGDGEGINVGGYFKDFMKEIKQMITGRKGEKKEVNDEKGDKGEVFEFKSDTQGESPSSPFRLLLSTPIIDPSRSQSALARAYFIPGLSRRKNKYSSYSAFKIKS